MSRIALVRQNGRVDVYQRHFDPMWNRVWFTPEAVDTIDPQPQPSPVATLTAALLAGVAGLVPFAGAVLLAMVKLTSGVA